MPDGNFPEHAVTAQSASAEKSAEMHKKKKEILAFCKEAEVALNALIQGDSSVDLEKFKETYVHPLRFTARAINDHKGVAGEFISESHPQADLLHDFIQHRAVDYSPSDSAEIAMAINHIVGRFHEIKGE